jgi:hypothetical protein
VRQDDRPRKREGGREGGRERRSSSRRGKGTRSQGLAARATEPKRDRSILASRVPRFLSRSLSPPSLALPLPPIPPLTLSRAPVHTIQQLLCTAAASFLPPYLSHSLSRSLLRKGGAQPEGKLVAQRRVHVCESAHGGEGRGDVGGSGRALGKCSLNTE